MAFNTNTPVAELENLQTSEQVIDTEITPEAQVSNTDAQVNVNEEADSNVAEETGVEVADKAETTEETSAETTEEAAVTTELAVNQDGSVEQTSNEEKTQEKTEESIKIDFKPENFINNLGYMGKGMLGIFVVIGIIIASVYALGFFGKGKNNKQQ